MVEINQNGPFRVERPNNNFVPDQLGEKINFEAKTDYQWLSHGH